MKVGSRQQATFQPSLIWQRPYRAGGRVCVRTPLSPRLGWIISQLHPRLTPWALFLRRFAA